VYFGSTKVHFICVVVSGFNNATKNVSQLRLIVDELQQRLATCALNANAKNVFGGRVQADDQQALVEKDDA